MQTMITFIVTIMLSACVIINKDYTRTEKNWHGNSLNKLIVTWGKPDKEERLANGHIIYTYYLASFDRDPSRGGTDIHVDRNGRGFAVLSHSEMATTPDKKPRLCIMKVEVDKVFNIVKLEPASRNCF